MQPTLAGFLAAILEHGDFVGFTFLLATLAMCGASLFFLFERNQVSEKWRTCLLVSSLVTMIAGVNYAFMSAVWLTSRASPLEFRYLDWFLTVPLICLQFFLLLQASGAGPGHGSLWRLVLASVWMLAAGYVGQSIQPAQTVLWGAVSSIGYAAILFEISLGEVQHLGHSTDNPPLKATFDLLFRFIFIGWAIYPLGYMTNPGNLLAGLRPYLNLDIIFNLGDAVNKIGFGLVVWNLARSEARQRAEPPQDPLASTAGRLPQGAI